MSIQAQGIDKDIALIEKIHSRSTEGRLRWNYFKISPLNDSISTSAGSNMTVNFLYRIEGKKWSRFWVRMDEVDIIDMHNPKVDLQSAQASRFGESGKIYEVVDQLYRDVYAERDAEMIDKAISVLDAL